ncbi:MAG: ATP-binding protein [Planctomycetota bacterium]|jgi:DNA topoisomerase VI subunit B
MSIRNAPTKGKLERTTFATSRLLDFCSEKELTAQAGHDVDDWPLVVLKELLDNSLDACEEAGIAPEIDVNVDDDGISVDDNGPGIPDETVKGILDYSIRVSSREAYVAPDRGAQGNALKTVFAMPFVLSEDDRGRVDITAHGHRHEVTFEVHRIRQEPAVTREVHPVENVKNGTRIKVWWPDSAFAQFLATRKRVSYNLPTTSPF